MYYSEVTFLQCTLFERSLEMRHIKFWGGMTVTALVLWTIFTFGAPDPFALVNEVSKPNTKSPLIVKKMQCEYGGGTWSMIYSDCTYVPPKK